MGGDVNLFRAKGRLMLLLALLGCHLSLSSAINDADLDGLDTLQAPIGEGDGATTKSKEEEEGLKLEKGATTDSFVISQGDGGVLEELDLTPDLTQEERQGKQYRLPPFSDDVRGFRRPQDDRRRYGVDRGPPRRAPTRRKGPNPLFDPDDFPPILPPPRRNMDNRRMDEGDDISTRRRIKIDLRKPLRPRLREEGISSLDMREEKGALSPSSSNYYEWESRKVGEEPIAFTPHIRLDARDIPRRTKSPTIINATRESPWMPAGKSIMEHSATAEPPPRIMVTPPRLLVTPKYVNSDDLPRRPGLSGPSSPSPDNSKLHTEYFSLPKAVSEGQRTPSKIPVLVKKLAKRPVKRNKPSFEPPLPPPPPFVPKVKLDIKSTSDHCANSDIDCGNDKSDAEDGSVVRGKAKKLLDFLRGEIWVIPVLVFALALAVFLLVFEIFLISKAVASTPSRRHLFLGQTLMLGLLMCCATTILLALKPTPPLCAASRVGIGLSYSVVYATLLVKLVFLISLNSGVYLPATYQCLLLCFAILIQMVIGVQWLFSSPASVLHLTMESGEILSTCDVTFRQHILGLLYVIFLVAVVVVLAFKSRGVRENYREAMYIGLTMFFSICIFALWMVGGFLSPPSYGDACLAAGLVASAAITFVIMFMPKGRQLSAMGRDGLYSEDRQEMYAGAAGDGSSSPSTGSTGGTPSPSFFPVKPGKLPSHHNHHHRDRMDTPPPPPSPRKQVAAVSSSSPFPSIIPPPPPPPEATSFNHNFHRSASSHHLHHHSPSHHHNHHHHHHSSIDLDDRGHDSMDNLVGTHQHHHQSRGYNTHHSVFRGQFQDGGRGGGGGDQFGRWRSRSSPPVARRLKSWATSQNDLTHLGDAYDDDAIGRPRTNFHSSFHDLHLANEARASRHDLSQMREEVVRGFRGGGGERSSRRNFRKWPLPPPGGKGSPSCRRYHIDSD